MKIKTGFIKIAKFPLFPYAILTAVVAFSYHQLLGMYFWRDDYTGLYIAQQGNLSANPIFAYPYHISLLLDQLAWSLFGLNAIYHFLAMIILYILASWVLFYFLQKLFSDKKLAFWCSLIFAAGYVGQDGMKMTMDGSNALVALIFLLISFISLILYHQKNKKILFLISLIGFFLTLEISPHRASSSLLVLLLLDWVLSWKKKNLSLLFRNVLFILLFLVQSLIHPSVLLLGYQIRSSFSYSSLLFNFSPLYILNFLGTFWYMIMPASLQEQFNFSLGIPAQQLTLIRFWLSSLPLILFIVILIIYLKILRPTVYSFMTLGKIFIIIIIVSFLWAKVIYQLDTDKHDLVAIFNGGILLVFLLNWIGWGISKFKLLSLFSLMTVFGILGTFFLTIPDRILVSFHRYLLLPSFAPSLLPIIFVTQEFNQREMTKKRLAQILVIGVVIVLVVPRLMAAYSTQKEFTQDYSQHAKKMYQDLKFFLPQIDTPTIIYIEGVNKPLQFAVGDAARVGYFGSEAAYAVHYQTQQENIILPQTLAEIPVLLKKYPKLSSDDVYTFIYDGNELRDTSPMTRKLLSGQNQTLEFSAEVWKKEDYLEGKKVIKFIPPFPIWTLLPMQVKIPLKLAEFEEKELKFYWEYNTEGLITENKFAAVTPFLDNRIHEYKFIIPGGGEYLKTIYFNIPNKASIEIGKVVFNYLLDE